MKITLKKDIKKNEQNVKFNRHFSHLIQIPGLRKGRRVPVECTLKRLNYRLVTPRRLKVSVCIELKNNEVQIKNGANIEGTYIYWKNRPEVAPSTTATMQLEQIFAIPDERPPARRITSISPSVRLDNIRSLTNRLAVKGALLLAITYQPR